MKSLSLLILTLSIFTVFNQTNLEALCARCVEARENNARNVNEYFYYEDFLDAQGSDAQQ